MCQDETRWVQTSIGDILYIWIISKDESAIKLIFLQLEINPRTLSGDGCLVCTSHHLTWPLKTLIKGVGETYSSNMRRFISCTIPLGLLSAYWRILGADWTACFQRPKGLDTGGENWAFSILLQKVIAVNVSDSLVNLSLIDACPRGEKCATVRTASKLCYSFNFNQIYLSGSDNKFCFSLCCSLHHTSWSLIKVNKLFIYCHFLRNGLGQNASSGSRSQMQRLRRWHGSSVQSRLSFQMILSGLCGGRRNHRSAAFSPVQHSEHAEAFLWHHLFTSDVEAAWTQLCKYQLRGYTPSTSHTVSSMFLGLLHLFLTNQPTSLK